MAKSTRDLLDGCRVPFAQQPAIFELTITTALQIAMIERGNGPDLALMGMSLANGAS
jgi:hypothetical protein